MTVSPIPEGFHTLNCYAVVPDANEAIAFYEKAFGAERVVHMPGPGGQGTMHAEVRIGDSVLMLTDENPQWNKKSAVTLGGSPIAFHLYCEDVDGWIERAVAAGCEVVMPASDMFWGDRFGQVRDPFGLEWSIATHVEDVPPEEMAKRAEAWFSAMAEGEGCHEPGTSG